jgi:hypothetical protein
LRAQIPVTTLADVTKMRSCATRAAQHDRMRGNDEGIAAQQDARLAVAACASWRAQAADGRSQTEDGAEVSREASPDFLAGNSRF